MNSSGDSEVYQIVGISQKTTWHRKSVLQLGVRDVAICERGKGIHTYVGEQVDW